MTTIPVFREGKWIAYRLPSPIDPFWEKDHCFEAASFYATALHQGYSPTESDALAQVFIMKKVYQGLEYPESIKSKIQKIMGRVETT